MCKHNMQEFIFSVCIWNAAVLSESSCQEIVIDR